MQFKTIAGSLSRFPPSLLVWYGVAVSLAVVGVRFAWVYLQGVFPASREPSDATSKEHWQHVTVLAWSGMRGGVSLAAAFAIPLMAGSHPFPNRQLLIFLTMCVLLATLVVQGGTLPALMRGLRIRDDRAGQREERIALSLTAKAALARLAQWKTTRDGIAPDVFDSLHARFSSRWKEFAADDAARDSAAHAAQYQHGFTANPAPAGFGE
jgi:hypothetical protein